jgi:fluoride exporter
MMNFKNILLVGFGGGIGAILRFVVSSAFKNNNFPTGTFLINIIGSLCIGIVFAFGSKNESLSSSFILFLMTGICGGFTTFSAFSLESMQFLKEGNYTTAFLYIFSTLALCILSVFAGFKLIN